MKVIIEESEYKQLLEAKRLLDDTMIQLSTNQEMALSLNYRSSGPGGYHTYPISFTITNPSEITNELVKRNEEINRDLSRALAHLKSFSQEIEPMLSLRRRTFKQIINERHGPYTFPYSW